MNKMKGKVEAEFSYCQAGYRRNLGTIEMLFILQILIEKLETLQMKLSPLLSIIVKRLTV